MKCPDCAGWGDICPRCSEPECSDAGHGARKTCQTCDGDGTVPDEE